MKWNVISPPIVRKLDEPAIFFIQDFEQEKVPEFKTCIEKAFDLDQTILPIYIESYGGEVYTLNYIVALIDKYRKLGMKFSTICDSYAMSCGADLFCYGEENLRFLGEGAHLMFHSSSVGTEGKIKDVRSNVRQVENMEKDFHAKIDKHLKKKKGFMEKLIYRDGGADVYVSAKEATELGLATIGTPKFSIELETKIKVEILP